MDLVLCCFGDLAWVPWTYSLQARYLSIKGNEVNLGWTLSLLIVGLQALGFYIFRSANKQKSDFRQGKLPHLKASKLKLAQNCWWKAGGACLNTLIIWVTG